jgi:NAD(P)-dependent dehydrogenase (short-subunit alcohol dehydrogenase family)
MPVRRTHHESTPRRLLGTARCPEMLKNGGGTTVNTASTHPCWQWPPIATKGGVVMFTSYRHGVPAKIRVNCVCPGASDPIPTRDRQAANAPEENVGLHGRPTPSAASAPEEVAKVAWPARTTSSYRRRPPVILRPRRRMAPTIPVRRSGLTSRSSAHAHYTSESGLPLAVSWQRRRS